MATSPTVGAEAEAPALARFWRAFRDATAKPSLTVVCGSLLLAALQFGAVVLWLTPDRIAASPHGAWMNDPWDYYAYVTTEALRMQRADPSELAVVVVGSSSTRHVFEDHEAFRARVEEQVGEPVRLHFLASGGQTLWESALLLDHLPEGFRGVVVIGLHPGRAIWDEADLRGWLDNPRLGLRSETTASLRDRLGMEPRETTGSYFLDNIAFWSARRTAIVLNWIRGPHRYERHGREISEPPSAYAIQLRDTGAAERMLHWREGGEEGARTLAELTSRLSARGIEVLVLFSPLHPNVPRLHPAEFRRFRDLVEGSARQGGAHVVDLNARAHLEEPDFRDAFHLDARDPRERSEAVLAQDTVEALRRIQARAAGRRGAAS